MKKNEQVKKENPKRLRGCTTALLMWDESPYQKRVDFPKKQ